MRNILAGLFSAILLCGAALAQQTPPPTPDTQRPRSDEQPGQATPPSGTPTPETHSMKIAPGTVIPVQLAKTVDAKKAKTGDEVVATVAEDMKTNSGEILLSKDTKVIGHVTAAQARSKEQKQSELGIAFDHALVNGDPMQLPMSIQAVIAPQTNNPDAAGPSEQSPTAGAPSGSLGGGRPGSMGGGSSLPQSGRQNYPPGQASETGAQGAAMPPITADTQGVIGLSNVKLEASQNSAQGSVLSSEKNNVKIEKGTMMLLKVHQ